jgi:membrane-associated protein
MCSQGGAAGELTGRTSRSDDADGARDDTRRTAARPAPVAYGGRVSSPRPTDAPPGERPDPRDANGRGGQPQPLPWQGRGERADWILLGGIAASTLIPLLLLPLTPALVSSHPALLEALRGSTASVINMGARARIGETSIVLAVLLGVPSLMMFDWVYWWAGRRWGDAVFVWLLGGPGPKTQQRLDRLHRIEAKVGPFAVVFAYLLPIPAALVYAAVGDGGMRLWVFLLLDVLGTLLWTGLLSAAGYGFGQGAVDVADTISHYGIWATLAIVLFIMVTARRRQRR